MRPRGRICEWRWSDVTEAGWLHDNDNMPKIVRPDYIHTIAQTFILYRTNFLVVVKYLRIQNKYLLNRELYFGLRLRCRSVCR